MNRRHFCGNLCTATLALASRRLASAASLCSDAPSADADPDSYAIWSVMIPLLRPDAHAYLIPGITSVRRLTIEAAPEKPLTPIERAMKGVFVQVQVPEPVREEFIVAARRFAQEDQTPVTLDRSLNLARPYRLMDKADLDEYQKLKPPTCVTDPAHPWRRNKTLERKYAGFASPCLFSSVSFDSTRSLGVVWGESAAGVSAYSFEKDDAGWKRREWPSSAFLEQC